MAATAVRKALKVAIIAPSLELVEQDAAAAIGATTTEAVTRACAGIGPVDLSGRIVVATAGSIVRREIPAFDLLLIDEAHRFSAADETMLGKIVSQLREKNPQVMIGGLTATPFRGDGSPLLGNGGRFSKIAYQVGYIELVQLGFLAPIVAPKAPIEEFDLKNVRVRAGEYDPRDLATRFGDKRKTEAIAVAVAQYAADRNSIIVFAINVQHAHDMATA